MIMTLMLAAAQQGHAQPMTALALVTGLLIAGLVLSAASAGYQAYSGYQQGEYQKDMADYQEAVAERNATLAAQQAETEQQEQAQRDRQARRAQRQRMARIEGMYAKSGVLLEGSPSELMIRQATVDEFNLQEADRISRYRQNLLRSQSSMILSEGQARSDAMRFSARQSQISAGVGLVGSLSQIALTGYMLNQPGPLNTVTRSGEVAQQGTYSGTPLSELSQGNPQLVGGSV